MIGQQFAPQAPQAPMPPMAMGPPPMVPNPEFEKWAQEAQAWIAEKQKREQQFQAAYELVKSDAAKSYKIDIEADSTIAADEQAEKQARTEFLQAITPFIATVLPLMRQDPALAALGKEVILFGVRAFPISRSLEDAFETALDQLVKAPPQPPPGKTGNTKSPMEIQTEAATEQGKQKIDLVEVAAKIHQTDVNAQIAQQKMALEHEHNTNQLMQQEIESRRHEELDRARIQRMAQKNSAGLV